MGTLESIDDRTPCYKIVFENDITFHFKADKDLTSVTKQLHAALGIRGWHGAIYNTKNFVYITEIDLSYQKIPYNTRYLSEIIVE